MRGLASQVCRGLRRQRVRGSLCGFMSSAHERIHENKQTEVTAMKQLGHYVSDVLLQEKFGLWLFEKKFGGDESCQPVKLMTQLRRQLLSTTF